MINLHSFAVLMSPKEILTSSDLSESKSLLWFTARFSFLYLIVLDMSGGEYRLMGQLLFMLVHTLDFQATIEAIKIPVHH